MTTRLLTAIGCAALLAACGDGAPRIDAQDAKNVAAGKAIYARHCAACHGANLEGQPNWRRRLPNGRLPAPPHDASGHTWHHPDTLLFGIVKNGLVPPYAPAGYASDMPAFGGVLSDDQIRAVLAYIQSRWPKQVMEARAEMLRGQAR
jgi:mono/diheme cytochrome c family protein